MVTSASQPRRRASGRLVFGYANVIPFVFFALFPFYYMVITSLKNDAELYNLKSIPFLDPDRRDHRSLSLPVLQDRVPDLDEEQSHHQRGGDGRSPW